MKKMKKKYKWIILICIVGVLIDFGLYSSMTSKLHIKNVQEIRLELSEDDGQKLNSIRLKKDDTEAMAKLISKGDLHSDSGFVFAPGGFRIKIETENDNIYLYPYCGDVSTVRVNHHGSKLIDFNDKEVEAIEKILEKYINTEQYSGDCDWDKVQ